MSVSYSDRENGPPDEPVRMMRLTFTVTCVADIGGSDLRDVVRNLTTGIGDAIDDPAVVVELTLAETP